VSHKADCILWLAELKFYSRVWREFNQVYHPNKQHRFTDLWSFGLSVWKRQKVPCDKSFRRRSSQAYCAKLCFAQRCHTACPHGLVTRKNSRFKCEVCFRIVSSLWRERDLPQHNVFFFSDEAKFHVSVEVNRNNFRVWGSKSRHDITEHKRGAPKVNVGCALMKKQIYRSCIFGGEGWYSVTCESVETIFQLDGAPHHLSSRVLAFLDRDFPDRWTEREGQCLDSLFLQI